MIEKLLSECTDYDYKEQLEIKKPRSWLKSVSAFANGCGGSLFFGINNEGDVVGINDVQYTISKITELIKTRIEPIPIFRIIPYEDNNLYFIQLIVSKGQFTPYYYHADGNRIAYVRSGDESIESPLYILNELILKGIGQTYDSILTTELKRDYSFSYLQSKYYNRLNNRLLDEDFTSFELSDGEFLTRAGILFADINKVRQSRIFLTRWNGVDKLNNNTVINDNEINGSVLIQLDRAMEFFKANTNMKWHKEKGETIYEPDYDEETIKEAIVNAIVHRDYNVVGAEIVVNIYDDRIEITSPGGMYLGKNIPNVVDSVIESKRRNPIIADLFHRLKLMNRRGSGLANITNRTNELFKDNNNHVFFESNDEFFIVKIQNANYRKNNKPKNKAIVNSLTKNEAKIIDIMRKNPTITVNEIARKLNISHSTVIRTTNKLTNSGLIARIGTNRGGSWKVNEQFPEHIQLANVFKKT